MIKNILIEPFFTILLLVLLTAFFGCDQRKDNAEDYPEDKTEEIQDKDSVSSGAGEATGSQTHPDSANIRPAAIPDITGKWTGTFDKRSTVLEITGQTDSSFTGKISISYREPIHQQVNGSFSPTNMNMSMSDQLHSRYQGKYNGVLSEDFNNFSGTFTMTVDNSKYAFNLNKK
ncbi:MAG TPA: hypothetical protein VK870_12290 [Ignavibacteriaceae bacterium]|nr:hypothetical protein [Ignavibacteriaceae bacterium]